MTLVSGIIRYTRIFAGFFLAGASDESGVVDYGNFWRLWLLLRKLRIRPPILNDDMLPLVGRMNAGLNSTVSDKNVANEL